MVTQPCQFCGLPVRCRRVDPAQPVFCCTGCAIAAQIPVDAQGQFPVNKALVGALALAFVYFNQALFTLLNGLLLHQQKGDIAARFGWLAVASAAVVWLTAVTLQLRSPGLERRIPDYGLWVATALIPALLWWKSGPPLSCMLLTNLLLLGWGARGLLRRRRREEK